MRNIAAFDTHSDFLIQRYKHGVQLVRPCSHTVCPPRQNLSNLYNLDASVYFHRNENIIVDGNELNAKLSGAESTQEMKNKSVRHFAGTLLGNVATENHQKVIESGFMQIFEEAGTSLNQSTFHVMSFKFPWYYDNQIIGIFGFSIRLDADALPRFTQTFSTFLSMGLTTTTISPIKKHQNITFSTREENILKQLVRGKTAKDIGERLKLSRRTIEHYLENIKLKTHCKTKYELVDKFIDEFI